MDVTGMRKSLGEFLAGERSLLAGLCETHLPLHADQLRALRA